MQSANCGFQGNSSGSGFVRGLLNTPQRGTVLMESTDHIEIVSVPCEIKDHF